MLKYGLSLAALIAANPAFAQVDDEIVVTAAGIEQSRDEVGQAIAIIDADTIKTRQAIDVVDLLATTPGVRFNRNGTVGAQTGVSLRGAETTQTLVLIDGVKVNDPSGIGDGYDFGPLLTGNIRRIEVLRGSNSVVHGSQAIGGVVNIMTGVAAEGFGANASAEYGYADTFSAKADVSGTAGIASGGIGAAYFRTDGISSAANGTERDGTENIAANARVKLAFSDTLSLDLRGYYIHADLDVDGFPAPDYILSDTPEVAITDQYVGYAGINLALLDGKLTNRAAVTWMRNDRDYLSAKGADVDYGYSGTNLRFEYEGVYAPVDQAKLVFGYEHERPDYDYYDAFSTTSAKTNIDSVYALAIVKPFTGLAVTGGLRHDDHSQFGGATTFGANANYSPNGGATNVRLSYGEGFKAPSLYQLYDSWNGNAALTPERSKSYDIGFDQSLDGGRAQFSVTAFRRDTRNQINYDNDIFRFGNLDRTRAKGVEASIALKPVEALTVTGSYSYVDARDRTAGAANFGNRLARRAANAVSVSADYVWPFGLSTGATITMVGDSFDNAANTRRLDGYALAGVRASFPVGEHLEVYGRVDNLTDENYQTAYGYGTYGRAAYGGVRVRF